MATALLLLVTRSLAEAKKRPDIDENILHFYGVHTLTSALQKAAEPLLSRLRGNGSITADDLFALPLGDEPKDVALFEKEVEFCHSCMLCTNELPDLFMEQAALLPFDYALVPFPIAVALYILEKIGGLNAKLTWSIFITTLCWQAHIDLTVSHNPKRPRQRIRPRLPTFACAEPGSKKSPCLDTFLHSGVYKRLRDLFPYLLADTPAGYSFSGGSTAKACEQLLQNDGYLGILVDEASSFFPLSMATKGDVNESQHLKPQLLLPFRTGAPPERMLLKHKKDLPATQVAMVFLSQFPAARSFLVPIVKHLSIGWAQGFIFTYSRLAAPGFWPLPHVQSVDRFFISSTALLQAVTSLCSMTMKLTTALY